MSIIIKGMDMPISCGMCRLADKWADDTDEVYIECMLGHTFDDCPLVEIPTPHGRLIDADALMKTYDEENWSGYYCIAKAPTILEAEE